MKKSKYYPKIFIKNYNFKISKYEKIKYKVFPVPNLEFENVLIDLNSRTNLNKKNFKNISKIFKYL